MSLAAVRRGARAARRSSSPLPTFGATSASPDNATGTLSWSHTVGSGANRLLLVVAGNTTSTSTTVTNVTYGGVALTHVVDSVGNAAAGSRHLSLWAMVNPPVGTATVVVTCDAIASSGAQATSFAGVNQSSPYRTPVTDDNAGSVSALATTIGAGEYSDLVYAVGFGRTTTDPVPGAGQTQRFAHAVSPNARMVGSTQPGGESVTSTFSWTTPDAGSAIAVALRAAAPEL